LASKLIDVAVFIHFIHVASLFLFSFRHTRHNPEDEDWCVKYYLVYAFLEP
jgi:hypothetical protein